ncbi:uncharacterized protein LKV04_010374 [Tautogolabrus adspersus]
MLTRWMALTAFLAASADLVSAAFGDGSLTVAPTCRLKGHPEVELTLSCRDERKAGIVQYWHTPFGDLETPGTLSKLDPVFMHHDGSLVVPNTSRLHSGLYYCLLQHKEGTTLWSYELHVGHNNQIDEDNAYEEHRCGAFRIRRDVGSAGEKQGGVSDEQFAGVVAASVLLTFVLGFSAGALTRTQVLRCLGAVTVRLRSPWQRQSDTLDHGSEVNMTTLPPMYDNQAFEMEQVEFDEDSATCVTTDSTISSTTSSPPAKPQRSFRQKREEPETTAYLEGCDYIQVKEEERKSLNSEGNYGEVEEETGFSGSFYISDKDGGIKTETDEDECSEDKEQRDPRHSREEKRQWQQEEELEEPSELESSSSKVDEEDSRGRRSRVIRLYQYDDDGQRYGHLPDPTPDEPGPAPRLKQRSLSLTRLNAIMAAASAGPLDTRETGTEGKEERPHFQMEI